jgi:hypothetical protein
MMIAFVAGFAALAGAAIAIAAIISPNPTEPLCKPYEPCGNPPVLTAALVTDQPWKSSALGFQLEYPPYFEIEDQSPSDIWLTAGPAELHVRGEPAAKGSPKALMDDEVSFLTDNLLSFARDTDPQDQLLGTNVGLRPGPGDIYEGTVATPQGTQQQLVIAVMASGDRKVNVVATVLTDPHHKEEVFQAADGVFKSVEWASDQRAPARRRSAAR